MKEKITYKEALEFYLNCIEAKIKSASLLDSFWKKKGFKIKNERKNNHTADRDSLLSKP